MNVSDCYRKAKLFAQQYDNHMELGSVYFSHEGYRKMVDSYNAICTKVKKLQKVYSISTKKDLYFIKLSVPLVEFIKLIKDIEQAEKKYKAVDKFKIKRMVIAEEI